MLDHGDIQKILSNYGLTFERVTKLYDTSHSEDDVRLNYILDDRYVLKVNSEGVMWESRLQEISRLIGRYRAIGVYCPAYIPSMDGMLSCGWEKDGRRYVCYVEEFAAYPIMDDDTDYDRREVVEHLGILAAKYSGTDLSQTRSMWTIIDLAPLDVEIDEKQENMNMLVAALREYGHAELAERVEALNTEIRRRILTVFRELPRCVYQGDLNSRNILHREGHFAGLIDFNLSGTDVNINVFTNETNCFPEEEDLDVLTPDQILGKMASGQEELLSVIFKHYTMDPSERYALPLYQRIADLFQWPNVCSMVKWLKEDARREKCAALIRAMVEKPLEQ